MLRKARLTLALAVAALMCIPSLAVADAVDGYRFLLNDHLNPAPLAPTSLPAAVGSFNDVEVTRTAKGGNTWYMDFFHRANGNGPADAWVGLDSVGRRSLSKTKRKLRKLYSARKTTIRGRSGLAFKRRKGQGKFLAWVEDGILYEISTPTPKKISDSDLRTTAAGLEHLRAGLFGESRNASGVGHSPVVFVLDRHVLLGLNWDAPCFMPGETIPTTTPQGGAILMAPLNGGSFSAGPTVAQAIDPGFGGPASWTVSASGTASVSGGQLTAQASGSTSDSHCSVGPLDVGLRPI